MRILVTGASGFVGRAIVAELLEGGNELFCLVSPKLSESGDLPNVLRVDISDPKDFSEVEKLENIDAVIHCAGLAHKFGKTPDEDFWKVNVKGTEHTARLAVRIRAKHFILISSVAVYGDKKNEKPVSEQDSCQPQSVYAVSKYEAERVSREICGANVLPLTILRPATVIGEGDRGNTARLVRAIDRRRFFWIGRGENRKSLIYKTDVARACAAVLAKKTGDTEIFNVTAEAVEMKFIVEEIAAALNKKIPKPGIPVAPLEKIIGINARTLNLRKISSLAGTIEKWISDDVFACEKIAKVYGFRARTTIAEAIRRQVDAYLSEKHRK